MESSVQQIIDEAAVELPGCPRPLIAMALRDTSRDLLDRALCYKVALTAIDIVAAQYLYDLTLPAGYTGFAIRKPTLVVLNGEEQRPGIDWRMSDRDTIQLRDEPPSAITGGLEVTVALTLGDLNTADLADLEDYYATLGAGVKARLMLMPRKPWTDQPSGLMYRSEYNDGLGRAMLDGVSDGLNEPVRVRM
jgi:hypothetical protein